mgnify:CR=1 FL=1
MGIPVFKTVDPFIKALEKSHIVRMQLLNNSGIDQRQGSQPDNNPAKEDDSETGRIARHPRVFHRYKLVNGRSQPHDPIRVNRSAGIHKTM